MAHANEAAERSRFGRARRAVGGVVGAALAVALAGCGAGEGLDGAFGSQDVGVTTGNAAGVSNTNTTPGALTVGAGGNAVTYECPSVTVRSGAATWQVTDRAGGGGLRYQSNIGQLARECAISGQNMTVKIGIEGRVLMGEKGTPGTLQVPIRIAVVQEGPEPKTVTTKFFNVPVQIPAGQGQSAFTVVDDQISFPLASPDDMERYIIYVGYDPQGEAKTKPAARPRPPASAAAKPPRPAAPPSSTASTPASAPAQDPGAPKGDVFGPPPGQTTTRTLPSSPNAGGFEPPPASNVFAPPPR